MKNQKTKKCFDCGKRKDISEFKKTKDSYTKSCRECISNKRRNKTQKKKHENFYIYRFLNKKNHVVYVGQTTNLHQRIKSHMRNAESLLDDKKLELYENTYAIDYCEVESDYHMNIYEIHYICKYKPKYNIQFMSDNINLFDLPKLQWIPYVDKDYMQDISLYYLCKLNIDPKELPKKLEHDKDFYTYFLKSYRKSKYIHKKFNSFKYMHELY